MAYAQAPAFLLCCAAPPPPYAKHERAVYLANMAAAEIGLKHWAEAASAASDALDEEPGYVKVWFVGWFCVAGLYLFSNCMLCGCSS